jgi:hypothetical protein
MNYLEYIKDFDNLAKVNESVYDFRKIFNSNLDQFISYYYSQQSEDGSKDTET